MHTFNNANKPNYSKCVITACILSYFEEDSLLTTWCIYLGGGSPDVDSKYLEMIHSCEKMLLKIEKKNET